MCSCIFYFDYNYVIYQKLLGYSPHPDCVFLASKNVIYINQVNFLQRLFFLRIFYLIN